MENLELTLRSRMHGVVEPPTPSESCEDLTTNDQAPPFSTAGTSGSLFFADQAVPFDVEGPDWNSEAISGSGDFSPSSALQAFTNGSGQLVIESWKMLEDAPTTVGTSSIQADVDIFRLALMGEHIAVPSTGSYKAIAAGAAIFDMSARIDGVSYPLQATNATQIKFLSLAPGVRSCPSYASSCWWHTPFTIAYEDSLGGSWTLDVPSKHWIAPLTFAP